MTSLSTLFKYLSILGLLFLYSCQDTSFYPDTSSINPGSSQDDGGDDRFGFDDGAGDDGGVDGTDDGVADDGGVDGGTDDGISDDGGVDGGTDDGIADDGGVDGGTDDGVADDGGSDDGGSTGSEWVLDKFEAQPLDEEIIDILWVVDNSGSMKDEQQALADNFDQFIRHFVSKDIDFKMSIISTDTKHGKADVNFALDKYLTRDYYEQDPNDFFDKFSEAIKVGVKGYHIEKGLYASDLFFKDHHKKFFRDKANASIIYVSDEEDQSILAVDEYVKKALAYKNNMKSKLQMHAIVLDKVAPSSNSSVVRGGKRYIKASELTNGLYEEITQPFAETLYKIGADTVSNLQNFILSEIPQVKTLEVYVDNQLLDTSKWEYNDSLNAIEFISPYRPRDGADIKVYYLTE